MAVTLEEMIAYYNDGEIDEAQTVLNVKTFWKELFPSLLNQACVTREQFVELWRASKTISGLDGKRNDAYQILKETAMIVRNVDHYSIITYRFVNSGSIDSYITERDISKGRYYSWEAKTLYGFAQQARLYKEMPVLIAKSEKKPKTEQ